MSNKQKALRLIEQSVSSFKELADEDPRPDYLEWNKRQDEASKPLDDAHTLWMNMKFGSREQVEVRNAWAAAEAEIERLLSADGAVDASEDTDEDDGYEPEEETEDEEPEDELDEDERAELFSSLVHDEFDDDEDEYSDDRA